MKIKSENIVDLVSKNAKNGQAAFASDSRRLLLSPPIYWIVNLKRRVVEVHSQPSGQGKQAGYAQIELYQSTDIVPVVLDGQEIGRVAVAELLP